MVNVLSVARADYEPLATRFPESHQVQNRLVLVCLCCSPSPTRAEQRRRPATPHSLFFAGQQQHNNQQIRKKNKTLVNNIYGTKWAHARLHQLHAVPGVVQRAALNRLSPGVCVAAVCAACAVCSGTKQKRRTHNTHNIHNAMNPPLTS